MALLVQNSVWGREVMKTRAHHSRKDCSYLQREYKARECRTTAHCRGHRENLGAEWDSSDSPSGSLASRAGRPGGGTSGEKGDGGAGLSRALEQGPGASGLPQAPWGQSQPPEGREVLPQPGCLCIMETQAQPCGPAPLSHSRILLPKTGSILSSLAQHLVEYF